MKGWDNTTDIDNFTTGGAVGETAGAAVCVISYADLLPIEKRWACLLALSFPVTRRWCTESCNTFGLRVGGRSTDKLTRERDKLRTTS